MDWKMEGNLMEADVLELLLSREPKSPREEKQVKIKRLSPKGEGDVVFTLKSLGYSRAAELKRKIGRASCRERV